MDGDRIRRVAEADWEELERDVALRIRLLAAAARGLNASDSDPAVADRIAQDLILPNMKLLAAFCVAVRLDQAPP